MIDLRKHQKYVDYSIFDYVFEDGASFESILPYLAPKLQGQWEVALVEPKPVFVRTFLDTSIVPSYIHLTMFIEGRQLEQLYLERPQLVEKEKSSWDTYMDLIKTYPIPIDDKALREIYYRKGPKEADLREALNTLSDYPVITLREVNKHFAPVQRVYASQVVRLFLQKDFKKAWKSLPVLERELGTTIAFYAMRKNIRAVFEAKCKYLQNEETKESIVATVDSYTIVRLYWWFEVATGPEQLYLILAMFEKGEVPQCLGRN